MSLEAFIRESNLIEGIDRDPTPDEIGAASRFMQLFQVQLETLFELQSVFAPGRPLRSHKGMNVKVGNYIAPPGSLRIVRRLDTILQKANSGADPWATHIAFEHLHPYMDGNGRTGRLLWAWQMHGQGKDPFALPFLHRFYYQTLENSSGRNSKRMIVLPFRSRNELRHRADLGDMWWQLLGVFLRRRVRMFRTLCTVSIVFDTQLEAEQFQKLLLRSLASGKNLAP